MTVTSGFVIFIYLLIILFFVSLNVAQGDVEDWRIKVMKDDKDECSAIFKYETVKETCKHEEKCLAGPPGPQGPKGQKGENGERGERGEKGKCEDKGTRENPATSCMDSDKKDNPYIFPPSPFKVKCDYINNRICFNYDKTLIKIDELCNTTHEKPYWLWRDVAEKSTLKTFYELQLSQLSHLISISDRVTQKLTLHCKYFELKDDLKILWWDNSVIGQSPSSTSPVSYTLPEGNMCQKFTDPTEWRSTNILIESWSGAAKNFYIPSKNHLEMEGFYIQPLNICFYF